MSLIATSTAWTKTDEVPYYFFTAANTFKLDVSLLYALCTVESRCNARALNKDDATQQQKIRGVKEHSHGLFQLKLATARGVGFKGSKKDLMQPDINTYYAAKLLSSLYNKYGSTEKVISAYNAGKVTPSNKDYVYKVLVEYTRYKLGK